MIVYTQIMRILKKVKIIRSNEDTGETLKSQPVEERKETTEISMLQRNSPGFTSKDMHKRALKFKNHPQGLIVHFIHSGAIPQIAISALNESELKNIQELLQSRLGITSHINSTEVSTLVYEKPYQRCLHINTRDRDDILAIIQILKEVYPKVDFGLIDDLIGIDKASDFKNLMRYFKEHNLCGRDEVPTLAAAFFNSQVENLSQHELNYVSTMIASGMRNTKLRKRREGDPDNNPLTRSVLIDDKGEAYLKGIIQGAGMSGVVKRAINLRTGEVFIDKTQSLAYHEKEGEDLRNEGILVTEIRRRRPSPEKLVKLNPNYAFKQHLLQIKIPGIELGKFLEKCRRNNRILSLPERLFLLIKVLEAYEPFLKAKITPDCNPPNILWDEANKQCTFIDPYINPKPWYDVPCPTLEKFEVMTTVEGFTKNIVMQDLASPQDPTIPTIKAITFINNNRKTLNLRTDVIEKLKDVYQQMTLKTDHPAAEGDRKTQKDCPPS